MALKEDHLRHAALLLIDHLPLDHEDALAVLEHVRQLIEWRTWEHWLALAATEADCRAVQ
jgi:hypothetical protein